MFNKKHRLSKSKDVKQTLGRGRAFFSPYLTVKFLKFQGLPRFTVVVSTKVSKRAVTRNRLKRIIRELLRANTNKLSVGNYAILLRPHAVKVEEKELLAGLEALLRKSRLLQ